MLSRLGTFFVKWQYADMVNQLSTVKSPQQMFGAVAKSYYAKLLKVDHQKFIVFRLCHVLLKSMKVKFGMNDAGVGPRLI